MKNDFISVRFISNFLFSVIMLFGFYIQFHGEISPGGGFQSGIIFACAFIIYDAVGLIDKQPNKSVMSVNVAVVFAALGVLIYGMTGFIPFLFGHNFFDYIVFLPKDPVAAQRFGLFSIETGVSLTVFGAIYLMYDSLKNFLIKE